jgi:hypothetical protein
MRLAHYFWAVLIVQIYEVSLLLFPIFRGHICIIASQRITPAVEPPLCDACDVQTCAGFDVAPVWSDTTQPAPEF